MIFLSKKLNLIFKVNLSNIQLKMFIIDSGVFKYYYNF